MPENTQSSETLQNFMVLKAMVKRIQRKRTKGWRIPAGSVYVGRGSRWGNPFVVKGNKVYGLDGEIVYEGENPRKKAVELYADWLMPYKHGDDLKTFYQSTAMHDSIVEELKGKNLCCWCALDEICHADWLLKIANE